MNRRAATRRVRTGALAAALAVGAPSALAEAAAPSGYEAPDVAVALERVLNHPGGLTAEQAAQRARTTSFDVKAKRADLSAAEAGTEQAALGFVPRVALRGSYMRVSDIGVQSLGNLVGAPGAPLGPLSASSRLANVPVGFTVPRDNYAVQADIVLPLSDYVLRLTRQYTSARHSARAAELTARAAELAVASNARILYYTWARTRLGLVVAEGALELARRHSTDVKAQFTAGQASQADLMQVEAFTAERELGVERLRNAVASTEDRLRTALHDPSTSSYEIGEPLLADIDLLPGENDVEGLVRDAYQRRLELRAVQQNAEALRDQARASRVALLPRLDAIGSATYANPNARYFPPENQWHATWAVGGAISWTSNDAILGGTGASAADARARGAEAQEAAVGEGIRDEVVRAHEALRDARTALASTERALRAAEESYRVRRALFRAGQATSTELVESENALTRARFDAVDARLDLRVASVELNHATGRDTAQRAPTRSR